MGQDVREFILSQVIDLMHIPVAGQGVDDDTPLGEQGLGMESLTLTELLVNVEREFGIKIDDSELGRLGDSTLGEFTAFVGTLRAQAGNEAGSQ